MRGCQEASCCPEGVVAVAASGAVRADVASTGGAWGGAAGDPVARADPSGGGFDVPEVALGAAPSAPRADGGDVVTAAGAVSALPEADAFGSADRRGTAPALVDGEPGFEGESLRTSMATVTAAAPAKLSHDSDSKDRVLPSGEPFDRKFSVSW